MTETCQDCGRVVREGYRKRDDRRCVLSPDIFCVYCGRDTRDRSLLPVAYANTEATCPVRGRHTWRP